MSADDARGPDETRAIAADAELEPLPGDLVAALATPAFWAAGPGGKAVEVAHVQTHISHVFLVGADVYKLKKAVRFPFLDFGTRARRRYFCAEELRLNRRLAAPVYLGVRAIVRGGDGRLALGGPVDAVAPEAIVEPVLHMRRLPADRLLPALLAADAVDAGMMTALAQCIAGFHREAPSGPAIAVHASPVALRRRCDDILAALRPFVGDVVEADEYAALAETAEWFVRAHAPLLAARQATGAIREGHGDLHAEHVCFVGPSEVPAAGDDSGAAVASTEASPLPPGIYVFDCIEFSEPFRCNDVASEVAFLAMDLEAHGRRDLAEAFVAAYVAAAGDRDLRTLAPYYAMFRACVRATVAALTSTEAEVEGGERAAARARAAAYVALALRAAWRTGDPVLIVCCGRSGTGKSTLAAALADPTDAVLLRSDVIRKRDGGPDTPAERYTPAARAAVYAELLSEVDAALAAGRTVIADATFLRRADRDAAAAVATRHGRHIVFVETVAPRATVEARLGARTPDDVSDARLDTYLAQGEDAAPWDIAEPHLVIATDAPPATVRARAVRALAAWRRARSG